MGIQVGFVEWEVISISIIRFLLPRNSWRKARRSTTSRKVAVSREERPGASVYCKNAEGEIFHTYSTYSRGLDIFLRAYNFLDITPNGRNEEGMKPHGMAWVRHHDRYQ